ncbi:hypothetical protein [Thauera sp. 27]|nr:hypothetical protein [Thauera sp. 27]
MHAEQEQADAAEQAGDDLEGADGVGIQGLSPRFDYVSCVGEP